MALIKLNDRSLGNNAVTSDAIATDAVTTTKLADNSVTMDKKHMDARGGAVMWSYDNSVASQTNSGWRTMSSKTLTDDATITTWNNLLSVTFFGYISSGTYYWAWRLYDSTDSNVIMPVGVSKDYLWYGNSDGTGGGFRYQGAVHSHSQQSARVFDITGRGGNTIELQMHGTNGTGDSLGTSSQTLYADQIFFYAGAMTGMHNETGY